jgi:hypothetical protein
MPDGLFLHHTSAAPALAECSVGLRAAFRICHDLTLFENDISPVGQFFMSCNDLAARLALAHPRKAQRILTLFESAGWIEITKKGTRHTKGHRGQAARSKWISQND